MKVVATILAVESRRQFAENLRNQVAAFMPVAISCKDSKRSLDDAFRRSKDLLLFATLQNADWHLYLEDDQVLTDDFFELLPRLIGDTQVDCWYLANRAVPIGQMGWRAGLRVNRIRKSVSGSHGLLYQTKYIKPLVEDRLCQPVDYWFWKTIDPQIRTVFQILAPVCATHVGRESTLHHYGNDGHLEVHHV